ncbi:MAG: hypothetical protein V7767_07910 [Leeuwenhoekiella sp.]
MSIVNTGFYAFFALLFFMLVLFYPLYNALNKKYAKYLYPNAKPDILISFDSTVDIGDLKIKGKNFNYNTLEPKFLKANSLEKLNVVFETDYQIDDEMHKYMKANKTECALKVYESHELLEYPKYILDAIKTE